MKCLQGLLGLGLLLSLGAEARAQLPPDKAEKTFTVADGLEFKLWASEPLFVNPTCIDIDHRGRVWVCESVNYRCRLHHKPLNRKEGDRIVILEDTKGTGKADKATTFYQDPEFIAPLGIAVAPYPDGKGVRVYVCHSPDILVFEDKDGDGKADGPPKKLLTGFNGYDHDHGVHGILIGPDMKLYFSVGDTGVKNLQSSDGKGRKWTSNDTDCRAGTIWRCDLDGKNLELLAHNFRNNYEPCVDSFGTIFISDNDDDGLQQTRICYVMPGGNYGYHPRGPGQSHWHEEQPGVVPKILRTGFGSPTGMCAYEGTLLPKKYHGQLLHTDAGPRHVRCYHLKPKGAGYDVDREDIVTSTDTWFRPSDICVAPDGSVFVADWYDPGVGGHGMGDTTRGRIYRLAPKGNKPSVPKVDLESTEGLLKALTSPALSVRYMAMAKFQGSQPQQAEAILEPVVKKQENVSLRARAMWQLGLLPPISVISFADKAKVGHLSLEVLRKEKDPRLRALAIRIFKNCYCGIVASGEYADEPSAAVRREALLASHDESVKWAKPHILALARKDDGQDRFYLEAIGIAVGHHDQKRREIILADFDKHFPEINDKVLDLIWELRPPAMMPVLGKLLADPKLPAGQRSRIVDILASVDDAAAGKALLGVLQSDVPLEVKQHVIDNLKESLPRKWRSLQRSPELMEVINLLLKKSETRIAALMLIGASQRNDLSMKAYAIAKDKQERLEVRTAAVQTLGTFPEHHAWFWLAEILKFAPASLRIEAVKSLGRLAEQNPRRGTSEHLALAPLQRLVMADDENKELRQTAVAALAGNRAGSAWLLELHEKKKLPDVLKSDVARVLRNSPYQDLRNKALAAFPPPGKLDPSKLPSIATLALRKGNPERGKQLMLASIKNDLQCQKCHTIRGVGGQIGPDLSMIGKKASRENLFESILYPSKAVADQYQNWTIETKAGLVLNGLIMEETPQHILLRDANGKDTKIDKKEIESRNKDPKSLMPDNLLGFMTEDDLSDIVEYLFDLKTPALAMDYWHIAGPFDNGNNDAGLDIAYPPEKNIDLSATYKGKAGQVRWRTVKPTNQGYVDLQAFLAPDNNDVVSYLYREIESPVDQEATLQVGTDDCGKLWINGKLVYTNRQHRPALPEQDTVHVNLQKGKNTILLKINNEGGPHGFYFTVLAEQELKQVQSK